MAILTSSILEALAIIAGCIVIFYLLFFMVRIWSKSKKNFLLPLLDKYLHGPGVMLFTVIILLQQRYPGSLPAAWIKSTVKRKPAVKAT